MSIQKAADIIAPWSVDAIFAECARYCSGFSSTVSAIKERLKSYPENDFIFTNILFLLSINSQSGCDIIAIAY